MRWGSNNTMTYLKPKGWYLKPLSWLYKCQCVPYRIQYSKYGIHAFDLKIYFDKYGMLEFRNGIISYSAENFYDVIAYCNKNNIAIKLSFEEPKYLVKRTKRLELVHCFQQICKYIESLYPNICIYGGTNNRTNEQLYFFNNGIPEKVVKSKYNCRKINKCIKKIYPLSSKHNTIIYFDFINM